MAKGEPAGYVRLATAISWAGASPGGAYREFYRGTIYPASSEHEYNWLIKNGICRDPYKQLNHLHPQDLRMLKTNTEVTLIRDIGIGDVLIISTLLGELQRQYERLRFSFATNSNHAPIFAGASCLSNIYQISKMRGTFHVIDLRGFAERHPDKHRYERIDIYSRFLCGKPLPEYDFPVPILMPREIAEAEATLSVLKRPVALVAARSATTHTRTIPEQQLRSMIAYLMARGLAIVLVHNEALRGWPCSLNLTGRLNIRQLAAVTVAADVVVTPDTGLLHIAEAIHTPHVDLFSAWPPHLRVTHYNYAHPIWKGAGLRCSPCYSARGPCPHLTCFKRITNEEIFEQVEKALTPVSIDESKRTRE